MSMDSARVSQFVKAGYYVEAPKRFHWVNRNIVVFQGAWATHVLVRMEDNTWDCDCLQAGPSRSPCCHVLALEASLDASLDVQVRAPACGLDSEQLAQSLAPILVVA
jgi:hypothetical protein